jgi:uncharacterized membrane protein YidH (DUF202 family)
MPGKTTDMNIYILLSIVCALVAILIALVHVLKIVNGKTRYQSTTEKKAIEQYKYLPKAGNTKQYCIGIILFLLIAAMSGCASSKNGTLPNGCKYKLIAPPFNK